MPQSVNPDCAAELRLFKSKSGAAEEFTRAKRHSRNRINCPVLGQDSPTIGRAVANKRV